MASPESVRLAEMLRRVCDAWRRDMPLGAPDLDRAELWYQAQVAIADATLPAPVDIPIGNVGDRPLEFLHDPERPDRLNRQLGLTAAGESMDLYE